MVNLLMSINYSGGCSTHYVATMKCSFRECTTSARRRFGSHYYHGLRTLEFHLLDQLVGYLDRFGTVSNLSVSSYEHLNFVIKRLMRVLRTVFKHGQRILDIAFSTQKVFNIWQDPKPNCTYSSAPDLLRSCQTISLHALLAFQKKELMDGMGLISFIGLYLPRIGCISIVSSAAKLERSEHEKDCSSFHISPPNLSVRISS